MSDCSASCSRREEPFEKTHRLAGGPLCRARKGRRIGTLRAADRSDRRSAVPGRRADEAGPAPELSHRRRDAGRRHGPVLARRGAVHDAHRHQDRHGADAHKESAAHPRRELRARLCHHRGRTGPAGAGRNRAAHQQHSAPADGRRGRRPVYGRVHAAHRHGREPALAADRLLCAHLPAGRLFRPRFSRNCL